MTTPGVGAIVGLTYVAAVDDPGRFKSSKSVGAHFGLTPTKYQSGETDVTGRISKIGDASVRTALYEAAHIILTRWLKGSVLKNWAMKLAKRTGMKKARWRLRASWLSSCTACWPMAASLWPAKQTTALAPRLERRKIGFRGRKQHQPSRSEVPSPGRWIRSDRKMGSGTATTRT